MLFTYEVEKLINSSFSILKELGWLLYNRKDQNGGLDKDELDSLLRVVSVESMEKEYKAAYDDGFNDGVSE